MTAPPVAEPRPPEPVRLARVALPAEHGGWAFAAEPALLGLAVAPSLAGAALGLAGVVAFLARTPLKLVLVDRRRDRDLPRTALARRVLAVEITVLVALGATAVVRGGWLWLVPVAVAAPLAAVELWFDVRSRSRRLVPELAGAVAVASVVGAMVLAAGRPMALAVALWSILGGRAVAAIAFVRSCVAQLHGRPASVTTSDRAQVAGVAVAAVGVAVDRAVLAGLAAVAVLAALHVLAVRRPPLPAVRLGTIQLAAGLAVVAITAVGVHAADASSASSAPLTLTSTPEVSP